MPRIALAVLAVLGCAFDSGSGGGGDASSSGASSSGAGSSAAPDASGPATSHGSPSSSGAGPGTASSEGGPESGGSSADDSGDTTGSPPTGPFATPEPLAVINADNANDDDPTLTADMLQIYFASDRMGVDEDIWFSTRASIGDDFDAPQPWEHNDDFANDGSPKLSLDGLVLTFGSSRQGGNLDIWIATRTDRDGAWDEPTRIDELASDLPEGGFARTDDEQLGMFCRTLVHNEIFMTQWDDGMSRWSEAVSVIGQGSGSNNCATWLSAAGDELWFSSDRPDDVALGNNDIWRVSVVDGMPSDDAMPVLEVSTDASDEDPWLSPDGATIFLASNQFGGYDIFTSERTAR